MAVSSEKATEGLGVFATTVLIAGEMAGSGVLALPKAVVDTSGWLGLLLILVFCINSAYAGTRLGKCWEILEERNPIYKGSSRDPYPAIAEEAMGKLGRYIVSVSNEFQLFGVGTVFLILASTIIEELLEDVLPVKITFCVWILIFAAVMIPPSWLGSPKDFWFVGVGALLTTTLSCGLIFAQIVQDASERKEPVVHKSHDFNDFFISFGVILFSFGGAATFPTIQNDMKERNKFSTSVYIGYTILLLIYLPIAAGGYWAYGEDAKDNIILSLQKSPLVTTANCLIALHLIMAFLIMINPVSQEIEKFLDVSEKFTFKRCVVRTGIILVMVFVAESVPQFGVIVSLLGASTIALTTFILPNAFYMILCRQEKENSPQRNIPWYWCLYMWILIIIGVVGGIASTYSALFAMFESQFKKPCYCE